MLMCATGGCMCQLIGLKSIVSIKLACKSAAFQHKIYYTTACTSCVNNPINQSFQLNLLNDITSSRYTLCFACPCAWTSKKSETRQSKKYSKNVLLMTRMVANYIIRVATFIHNQFMYFHLHACVCVMLFPAVIAALIT